MVAIVVGEFYQMQLLIIITFEVNDTRSKHIFLDLDGVFLLNIRLGVKRSTKFHLSAKPTSERPRKMRSALGTSIENDRRRVPMQPYNLTNVQSSILFYRI